jgi:flagellar basal-body rod protein FlgF
LTDALQAAAASLSSDLTRMTVLGHNLANAATPGYKRQLTAAQPFRPGLAHDAAAALQGASGGVDAKQGTLRVTDAPLDLAIDGDAYFELRTPGGTAYTRRGDFRIDASGQLVTQAGHLVMGQGGPLVLRSGNVVVTRDGRLMDEQQEVGQLKLVTFTDARALRPVDGGALFTASESAQALATDRPPRVLQGYLEASNVNTASEMVHLIETVRHFEAVQKVVQGFDDMRERALRKLGEF